MISTVMGSLRDAQFFGNHSTRRQVSSKPSFDVLELLRLTLAIIVTAKGSPPIAVFMERRGEENLLRPLRLPPIMLLHVPANGAKRRRWGREVRLVSPHICPILDTLVQKPPLYCWFKVQIQAIRKR